MANCLRYLPAVAALLLAAVAMLPALSAQDPVDFVHQIVPLVRQHCARCHLGREREGELSLNTPQSLAAAGVIEAGNPAESELYHRLTSSDEDERMPPDRPPLAPDEVELFRRWIAEGAAWESGFEFVPAEAHRPLALRPVELPRSPVVPGDHPIDRWVAAYAAEAGLPAMPAIDDAAFLRRISLDVVGLLPSPEELDALVADARPDKRARKIDELLARDRAYAEHWLSFWNDLLRNDWSGTGYIDGGRRPITGWLYAALLENRPYDAMVRQLLAPTEASAGFAAGIRWRGNVNASQSPEMQFAQNVGQVFLGINLKCASCHDSFVDRWRLSEAYALAAVVAETPLSIHRCDVPTGEIAVAGFLFPELGAIDAQAPRAQRMQQLAELVVHPGNGRLPRTIVNRLWQRMFGRGLVEPLDSLDAPAWHEDLLEWLAADLVAHDYDLKQTLRLIATSAAYQAAASPAPAAGQPYVFRGPLPRRLTAEQWVDAVWQLTGDWPPQPAGDFGDRGGLPVRAALVPASGLMRTLGRPNRDHVVTSRPNRWTMLEAIDLANGGELDETLRAGSEAVAARFPSQPLDVLVRHLFRAAISREPTAEEMALCQETFGPAWDAADVQDLMWGLVVQPEFCFVR